MIAAIYARKSTDQSDTADAEKSVTRQIGQARAYAARKGWIVSDGAVYADDGISGAEFAGRPGFLRLMNALKPKPAFQVLIMSEESRLGREAIETAYALKQSVRVFFYLEDRERTLDSPTDKIMLSLTTFADELEREKARQRTYDAMSRKAKAGQVTGGRVFGYTNVDVTVPGPDGRPKRAHVERQIQEAEAAVVRRIFELAAAGRGVRAIAKALNADGAACPQSQRNRPRGWAPSSVRCVLYRDLYRGEIVWNRTRKRDPWGLKKQTRRAEGEWMRLAMPALRIVPEPLWTAAHARLAVSRGAYLRGTDGRVWGRPLTGVDSKYLLPGLATCACCGGGLIVRSRAHGRRRVSFYACGSYHLRGRTVCTNNLEIPMDRLNAAVLEAVGTQVLNADVLNDVLELALAKMAPAVALVEGEHAVLETTIARLTGEGGRLATAIATGGSMGPLVSALADNQGQLEACRRRLLTAGRKSAAGQADETSLRSRLSAALADWRGLLGRQVPQARQILKKLLIGSVRCLPSGEGDGRYYAFSADATIAKIFASVSHPIMVASPTGFEPVFWP